ncbi:MAG TPA: cytochrome c biogenesis protein CcsA [Candidatus Krumholzibacteria bacterium]|jgi:ABC-type transport system involved in cytochrome c biogenesis permease subunit
METSYLLAFLLAPLCYLIAAALLLSRLWSEGEAVWAPRLVVSGILAQLVGLVVLRSERGVFPPASPGESLAIMAFMTAVLFHVTERRDGGKGIAVAASLLASLFGFSGAGLGAADEIHPALADVWYAPHALSVVTAFAAFTMSALLSSAYVLQYRQLRVHRPGRLSTLLPPLEALDLRARRMARIGFLSLTLGLALGMILAERVWGEAWSWDPKQCMTLLTWMLYGAALFLRRMRAWQGVRMAAVNLAAFVSVLLGLGIIMTLFDSAHRFG